MNLEQDYSLLKARRVYFGFSQAELAEKVKCTKEDSDRIEKAIINLKHCDDGIPANFNVVLDQNVKIGK